MLPLLPSLPSDLRGLAAAAPAADELLLLGGAAPVAPSPSQELWDFEGPSQFTATGKTVAVVRPSRTSCTCWVPSDLFVSLRPLLARADPPLFLHLLLLWLFLKVQCVELTWLMFATCCR